ncbi:SDR family oxidoreductase [Streptomyces sp. NPDC051940]|uniref:SDR family NAD(P)-dependent oxidoreductase n=1 Tax=Streptomyces sp. NPDC051940 TaxID=3155675 RepID=UPI0034128804
MGILTGKTAIIYGAAGSIGSATAKSFAEQGARVYLAGRTRETLEAVAKEITAAGGLASAAVVDALDEDAVEAHAAAVAAEAGGIDITFNLVPRGDVQGIPLADMTVADLVRPVTNGLTSNFITARAAARRMAEQGSGVILTLNSGSAYGSPMMGGTGPADGALDTLVRNLALELGPSGVRAVGIYCAGVPETLTLEKLSAVNANITEEAVQGILANLDSMRMTRRSPSLAEIVGTATFLASDQAGGITGTFVNVTGGMVAR